MVHLAHAAYLNRFREFLQPGSFNFESVWETVDKQRSLNKTYSKHGPQKLVFQSSYIKFWTDYFCRFQPTVKEQEVFDRGYKIQKVRQELKEIRKQRETKQKELDALRAQLEAEQPS